MRRVAFILAVAVLAGAVSAQPGAAASPPPGTGPPPCSVGPYLTDVDGAHRRYVISFATLTTGAYSGVVALYAGANRSDVPFHDVVAVEQHDKITRGGALIVAFPSPVAVDGAAVVRLTAPSPVACDVPYAPWRANALEYWAGYAKRSAADPEQVAAFLRWARTAPAVDAPPAIAEPVPSCAVRERPAATLNAFEAETPDNLPPSVPKIATAVVLVVLNADSSIYGVRIDQSSGNELVDSMALGAALRSKFRAETFRCKPAIGAFGFTFDFTRE